MGKNTQQWSNSDIFQFNPSIFVGNPYVQYAPHSTYPSLARWYLKKSLAANLMAFSGVTSVRFTAAPGQEKEEKAELSDLRDFKSSLHGDNQLCSKHKVNPRSGIYTQEKACYDWQPANSDNRVATYLLSYIVS